MARARRCDARTAWPGEQRCCVCEQIKPGDAFYKVKAKPFVYNSRCKACTAASALVAQQRRRERLGEQDKLHLREYKREWARAHPSACKASASKCRTKDEERFLALKRAREGRRRAAKRGSSGSHTASDIDAIQARQKGRCAACGALGPLTTDHIIALSRGGHNGPSNLQLLCKPCNSSKNARRSEDFMRERGFLL